MADEQTQASGASLAEKHHAHFGAILGLILIVLVCILAGFYLWGARISNDLQGGTVVAPTIVNNEPETPRAQVDAQILGTVSSSDALEAIEADVLSTNFDSLDAELNQTERELNDALISY